MFLNQMTEDCLSAKNAEKGIVRRRERDETTKNDFSGSIINCPVSYRVGTLLGR